MLLDIVILPPKILRERIGKGIIRATSGLGRKYIVDNKKYTPHLSLFHLQTNHSGLKQITPFLKRLVADHKPFLVRNGRFESPRDNNYLWYQFDLNRDLKLLQVKVRDFCAPLRTGVLPILTGKTLDRLAKQLRRRYGTQYLFERSKPHFSMASLKQASDAPGVIKRMSPKKIAFKANQIAITEVNLDGQVIKVIKIFKLS